LEEVPVLYEVGDDVPDGLGKCRPFLVLGTATNGARTKTITMKALSLSLFVTFSISLTHCSAIDMRRYSTCVDIQILASDTVLSYSFVVVLIRGAFGDQKWRISSWGNFETLI
jgi:hypothetical protein